MTKEFLRQLRVLNLMVLLNIFKLLFQGIKNLRLHLRGCILSGPWHTKLGWLFRYSISYLRESRLRSLRTIVWTLLQLAPWSWVTKFCQRPKFFRILLFANFLLNIPKGYWTNRNFSAVSFLDFKIEGCKFSWRELWQTSASSFPLLLTLLRDSECCLLFQLLLIPPLFRLKTLVITTESNLKPSLKQVFYLLFLQVELFFWRRNAQILKLWCSLNLLI